MAWRRHSKITNADYGCNGQANKNKFHFACRDHCGAAFQVVIDHNFIEGCYKLAGSVAVRQQLLCFSRALCVKHDLKHFYLFRVSFIVSYKSLIISQTHLNTNLVLIFYTKQASFNIEDFQVIFLQNTLLPEHCYLHYIKWQKGRNKLCREIWGIR